MSPSEQIEKFKETIQQLMQENQELHEDAVEIAQEIEDLEQELALAHADIALILDQMKKNNFDMTFVCRLNTQESYEEDEE
jgi:predicted  nucleic acid-binding Zn-ribbon protein